ncbi:MAG: carbohydrate ABC transporter permease [Anaerolineae bacterium]
MWTIVSALLTDRMGSQMKHPHLSLAEILIRAVIVFTVFVALIIVLFPVFWIFSTSLKTIPETYYFPPTLIPQEPTFEAYVRIWSIKNFSVYFKNSLIVSTLSTVLSVSLACLAAYGFSRFEFRGKRFLLFFFLMTQMVPAVLLLLPYFVMMRSLGLLNSYPALVFAYTSFALPFCTWMLKGFLDSIPFEIDDAALIDGCSRLQALVRVVLPLTLPGIAATTFFSFLVAWNHYLFALGLATNPDMYTLPVGISSTIGEFRVEWNALMAGAAVASVPTIVIYSFLERFFVQGLTAGAVKN